MLVYHCSGVSNSFVQVVMLGSGTEEYENSMRAAENEHSETFR